jgi:hypothetical protein
VVIGYLALWESPSVFRGSWETPFFLINPLHNLLKALIRSFFPPARFDAGHYSTEARRRFEELRSAFSGLGNEFYYPKERTYKN